MEEPKEKIEDKPKESSSVKECPLCGEETLVIVSRCATCMSCGYSLCSM
jgi:predicted RNA-binding Zn-ribbon protein involved in translation (DUF1610 family)